jgi:Tfp pilus assembly protein PilX
MKTRRTFRRKGQRGIGLLVVLIFLALFASLAVGIAASSDMTLAVGRNRVDMHEASALAEAGVQLIQKHIGGLPVPGTHTAADLHQAIAERLVTALAGSNMVNAHAITWNASGVVVPTITLTRADNRAGTVNLTIAASGGALDDTTVTVTSSGHFGCANRTVTYNLTTQRGRTALNDYGIASKSVVTMTGDARILGANDPREGSVLSATYSTPDAIQMTGNVYVSGDISVVNPNGRIRKTGNVTIGGQERIGVQEPSWPQVDQSVFTPYATNVRSSGASSSVVLSNVRIPPNSNPTFSGNTTILGVLYIQSPNRVSFTGNCNIVGTIVCQTPVVDSLTSNYVKFTGNVTTAGVESLPPDSQYDGLRSLTGSFLLAPGFSAQFAGNFSTINGCMVASEFKFTGNAGGRVRGGVVNLRDSTFQVSGNSPILIDKNGVVEHPAGIVSSYYLVCVSGSYSE